MADLAQPFVSMLVDPAGPTLQQLIQFAVDKRDPVLVPPLVKDALDEWARTGRKAGDFVMAVLRNDLQDAVRRADTTSLLGIGAILCYIHMQLPSQCHGSAVLVEHWHGDPEWRPDA